MKEIINRLRQLKIVPVISVKHAEDIIPLGEALANNGLPVAEITFRSPVAAQAISLLKQHIPSMLIGAGTVLTKDQVNAAKQAGAEFIVSPGLNPTTVTYCNEINLPIIPGINNPSSIELALELGIDFVKYFPAQASGGITMLKALLAPYHHINIMPTGGIGLDNIHDYLNIQQVVACGGSWMVSEQLIQQKEWNKIGQLTLEAVNFVNT
ncbi:bifunctional 4-hydroxy-2-oxoglutarate aldolase/2-dehydro-3-deoxy-phosphogluconate aldolase [Proteus vulgaris]|uniref:bifunctional 4-hydroxy-2-oxoglutarate aldolase/2-dehydro-3-deoxy-phosphogluconate aldolase n=1 Tax=Proteus vulgaris TaxID=585 RepID=UPI0018E416F8|nr:bifunctional 4-hydroxy-2-oxoglutarate aldolase/2-dehydro-3-deoxy-phosphogluconate aldolase [Proteus vulgaris]MBI6529249.1 bifunctional 4-hydroxy-2-oxoglutarate aldolase/2-dehydro-3-deoxy-phosphogluconate aldolase [Proteus vulgaris]